MKRGFRVSIILTLIVLGICAFLTYKYDSSSVGDVQLSPVQHASDFTIDGETSYYDTLSDESDNFLLFWASWCPHCENIIDELDEETPASNAVLTQLITVSEDDSAQDCSKYEGRFPIRLDNDWELFDQHGLEHIPALLVVEGDGRVVRSAEGEKECRALLEEYLQRADE